MKQYDVWFCSCGRLQTMPMEYYEWMQEDCEHRRVIRVCQNCGATIVNFLTDNGEGFDICGCEVRDTEISEMDGMEYRIIFNTGIKVPLMCGCYADAHQGNRFICWDYLEHTLHTTYFPEAEAKEPDCAKVDVARLIREVGDPDILKSISGYISGIDWSGTEYDWKK